MKQQYVSRLDAKVKGFNSPKTDQSKEIIPEVPQKEEPEKSADINDTLTKKVVEKSARKTDPSRNIQAKPSVRKTISELLQEPDKVQYHAKLDKDLYEALIVRSESTIKAGSTKPKISVNDMINLAVREFVSVHPTEEFIV